MGCCLFVPLFSLARNEVTKIAKKKKCWWPYMFMPYIRKIEPLTHEWISTSNVVLVESEGVGSDFMKVKSISHMAKPCHITDSLWRPTYSPSITSKWWVVNSWQQMREDMRLVTTPLCKAKHRANIRSHISSWDVQKCDCSSDKMIAGVMRKCNEKKYNDDNTVSNERIEEQWSNHHGKSSRY